MEFFGLVRIFILEVVALWLDEVRIQVDETLALLSSAGLVLREGRTHEIVRQVWPATYGSYALLQPQALMDHLIILWSYVSKSELNAHEY